MAAAHCSDNQQDFRSFLALLRACAKKKDLYHGTKVHADIVKRGLLARCLDALICMYAKCGALLKAKELFDGLLVRDVFSWTALIAGYAHHGHGQEALNFFEQMKRDGISPDAVTFACILKACGTIGAAEKGEQIHDEISRQGLLGHEVVLGNALVDMYAKCGALGKAQRVLEELPARDVVSWNTLIAGYVQHGKGQDALICFDQMQQEGLSPDVVTFTCILKACGSIKAVDRGEEIHNEIMRHGLLGNNIMLGNTLVDMYAKCGALARAQQVLVELPARDVVSWNTLIAGYADHGKGEEALNCFEKMQREGLSPDAVTFTSMLKACGSIKAVDKGVQIHGEIARRGLLGTRIVLGNALVDMYAKCGVLARAQEVLEELPGQDVGSWNALISGYVQRGQGYDALNCFEQMQCKGLSPDSVTFSCILKACGSIGSAEKGEQIHDEIARQGLLGNKVELGNALVDMYAKCGALGKAQRVFEELPVRDVVSWTALIAGYAQQGKGREALNCFDQMQCEGLSADAVTFTCILQACGSIRAADKVEEINDEIMRQGLLDNNIVLGNTLVDMYAKCGALAKAQQALEELPARDVVSWNALITGYVGHGQCQDALNCYEKMQHEGISPDAVTFASMLKACGSIGAVDKGKQIHNEIARQGLLGKSMVLDNALVDMYAKCGELGRAQEVLEGLPGQDVVSWNALIAGYVQQAKGQDALNCFEQMQCKGLSPDAVTFACILKACGSIGSANKGQQIHDEIARQGLLGKDVVLGNALVDMYAKCGALEKAQLALEELPGRDVVSWNSLIAGYAHKGQGAEALHCFERMQREGVSPDAVTFTCMLKACGSIGAADKGEQIYNEITNQGLLKNNILLGNALVDMYIKCGALVKARGALEELPDRDVITWNALIAGYAQQGQDEEALNCFECMQREGLLPDAVSWNALIAGYGLQGKVLDALMCFERMWHEGLSPDAITFVCMLNACSHGGLVDDGQMYFERMSTNYGIKPDLEHYICMVDLFGRAGHLDKAVALIEIMPLSDHCVVWRVLLGACWKWQDVNVGKCAFEHVVQTDTSDVAAYVLMGNIYAAAGMQEDAEKMEGMRVNSKAWKERECSWWIDMSGNVFLF